MKKHILIVDDEEHLAEGLAYNLRNAGYDVDVAGTGEDAGATGPEALRAEARGFRDAIDAGRG